MKYSLPLFMFMVLFAACTTTPTVQPWTDNFNQSRDPAIAAGVRPFIIRRQGCDHFRGEPGYDKERQKFLNEQIAKLCTGTDKKLARLRLKYAGHPATLKALAEFEDCIEYDSSCSTDRQEN